MSFVRRSIRGFLSISVIWIGFLILSFTVGLYAGYMFGKNIGEASGVVRGIKEGMASERIQSQKVQIHELPNPVKDVPLVPQSSPKI